MKYNIDKIMEDSIAKKWVYICMSEDRENPTKWFNEKSTFWKANNKHLESFGFTYNGSIKHALDSVLIEKIEDMEGCLLIVRIGTDDQPATATDVELATKIIEQALDGIAGIRVIVSHHALDIKKINLPQLRKIQSEVLTAKDSDWKGNTIIEDLEV